MASPETSLELVLRLQLRYLRSTEPRLVEMLEQTPRQLLAETIVRLSLVGFLHLADLATERREKPSSEALKRDHHRGEMTKETSSPPPPTGGLHAHFSQEQLLGMVKWE